MNKSPKYHAFVVKEREEDQKFWTRIGSACEHSKGGGLNIELDALPLDGKIVLLPPKDDNE